MVLTARAGHKPCHATGMPTTRLSPSVDRENRVGAYLKECRARLDPSTFGFSTSRRRTPGLRREEVAQRADVSATWYTWLEQGRGGVPSADVLDRLADALDLTAVEREYLFLLALNRPPEVHIPAAEGVSPRLQRVLDALELCPAFVKNSTWDVLAWNRAAAAVMGYSSAMPPERRNVMRRLFGDPERHTRLPNWEASARFMVAAFRTEVTRAGASARVAALVDELCQTSPEFRDLWRGHDVGSFGEGSKHLLHPVAGMLTLDYSAFAVDGQPDLGMVVFSPVTEDDCAAICTIVADWEKTGGVV